ncbi:MAG: hypothetical protein BWY74_03263 [Firmicutes bacterium ADurb.Bin419]|nr:MAG: hypothetical protein BWY74_03263 [Firmicutes bacterium ADurb.Bin419]
MICVNSEEIYEGIINNKGIRCSKRLTNRGEFCL